MTTTRAAVSAGGRASCRRRGKLTVGIDDLTHATPIVLAWLAAHGHTVRRVTSGHATLENVFLALTGRQLRD